MTQNSTANKGVGEKPAQRATDDRKEEHRANKHEAPAGVQPVEPEDPSLTGGSGSSQRELLEHNVRRGHAQQHPESPAGQHATGSFTGKRNEPGR